MAVIPEMRFGTDVQVMDTTDGYTIFYVTNAKPLYVKFPNWFTGVDKDSMITAIKESYLKSARRVLMEQTGITE